jgi:hypothetical protein
MIIGETTVSAAGPSPAPGCFGAAWIATFSELEPRRLF